MVIDVKSAIAVNSRIHYMSRSEEVEWIAAMERIGANPNDPNIKDKPHNHKRVKETDLSHLPSGARSRKV